MAGKTEYKNKWQQENKERVNLVTPKGFKENTRAAAAAAGESLNGYILKAVEMRKEREKKKPL